MELYLLAIGIIVLFIVIELVLIWRKKHKFSEKDRKFVVLQWESIRENIGCDPKHAVIDADKLLDFVLQKKGYTGSLGEKLKKAGKILSYINDVWNAHKLRNRIAHEVGFEVTEREARRALSAFKQALHDLGAEF